MKQPTILDRNRRLKSLPPSLGSAENGANARKSKGNGTEHIGNAHPNGLPSGVVPFRAPIFVL
jgi:hypothetical protein